MTASANHDSDDVIVRAEFRFPSLVGDRAVIVVRLGDGTVRRLLDWPVVEIKLRERNLVGRTIEGADAQVECWLNAARRGIHRIAYVEKIGRISRRHRDPGLNGDWEVVAFMSDASLVRVFAFYADEVSFTANELLDLSLEQAVALKAQREFAWGPDGVNSPDYSEVFVNGRDALDGVRCLNCGKNH